MALNTSKCNYLTPLHFKGLKLVRMQFCKLVAHFLVGLYPKTTVKPLYQCDGWAEWCLARLVLSLHSH